MMLSQYFPLISASAYPLPDLGYGSLLNSPHYRLAQPQMTVKGILTYAAVQACILADVKSVCEEMFPQGKQEGELYRTDFIDIGMDGFHSFKGGISYGPGSWFDSLKNECGPDLIGLIASWYGWTYERALACSKDYFELTDEKIRSFNPDEIRGWDWDRSTLRCALERDVAAELYSFSPAKRQHIYRNASGVSILIADEWTGCGDGPLTTYRALCRRKKDGMLRWLTTAAPSAPLPPLNADLIATDPTMPIHFVGTETQAEGYHPEAIYSTVPGGLRNLADVDPTLLAGRSVEIVLSPADIVSGALIRKMLLNADVKAPRFRLSGERTSMSFERLEEIADQRGITLTLPSLDVGRPPTINASLPGEPIPGSDMVRRMLFDPIILQSEIIWVYAPPKVGKSLFALATSAAVSLGSATVGKWFTGDPSGVLHVDGEMAPDQLQKLIDMVLVGADKQPGDRRFSIMCAKSFPNGIIDLETEEDRSSIEKSLRDVKLLVLDNFQSLTSNSPSALRTILPWLRKITRMGIAILVLDHTNREGDIQGDSTKRRIADLTIFLQYPDDDAKAEGRISVEFPDPRRLHSEEAQEFQLRKVFTKATEQSPASFRFELIQKPEAPEQPVTQHIAKMALVTFAKDHLSLTYPIIKQRYQIALSSAHKAYTAAKALSGADRRTFDTELERLIGGDAD